MEGHTIMDSMTLCATDFTRGGCYSGRASLDLTLFWQYSLVWMYGDGYLFLLRCGRLLEMTGSRTGGQYHFLGGLFVEGCGFMESRMEYYLKNDMEAGDDER